jgi:hypothetical protein
LLSDFRYLYDSMDRREDNGFNPVFSWKNRVVDPFVPRDSRNKEETRNMPF